MKKAKVTILFLLVLTLCGCSGVRTATESNAISEYTLSEIDAQNKYTAGFGACLQETPDAFIGHGVGEKILHYYDKKSGISGLLCADPSCMHNDLTCGAAVSFGLTTSYYDGKLYSIVESQIGDNILMQSNIDGTNQRKIKELSYDEFLCTYNPTQYNIHRGHLYFLGILTEQSANQISCRVTLGQMSLKSDKDVTLLFDETYDNAVDSSVRFIEDDVYVSINNKNQEEQTYNNWIYRISLREGAKETVYEGLRTEDIAFRFWVTNERELYFPSWTDKHSCLWKVENGERKQVLSLPRTCNIAFAVDGIVIFDLGMILEVYSFNGEKLYSGKLFSKDTPDLGFKLDSSSIAYTIVGGDREKIIISVVSIREDISAQATLLLDLEENLYPTVLWSEVT